MARRGRGVGEAGADIERNCGAGRGGVKILFWPLCVVSAATALGAGVLGVLRNAKQSGAPGRRSAWAGIFIGITAIILMLIQLKLAIQYSDSMLNQQW